MTVLLAARGNFAKSQKYIAEGMMCWTALELFFDTHDTVLYFQQEEIISVFLTTCQTSSNKASSLTIFDNVYAELSQITAAWRLGRCPTTTF